MTYSYQQHRRRFLQQAALSSMATAFPTILSAANKAAKDTATPGFHADVEIEFKARNNTVAIMPQGADTHVLSFQGTLLKGPKETLQQLPGSYLGPTINYIQGQKVRIYFYNHLQEPCIMHWHGLHVPQISDGHPMYAIQPEQRFVYEFEVLNRAGTSFYHAHTHGKTATQVYKGLAGLITVTDPQEQALQLPRGIYDIPLVIQDRQFNKNNQLRYLHGMHARIMGFLGEHILVNGQVDSLFKLKSTAYRFRALNASNSRIYKLAWDDGADLIAIGTDAGLLAKPVRKPYIMLAPGERVDLWVDFSDSSIGTERVLRSLSFTGAMPAMGGMGMGGMRGRMGMGGRGMGGMGMMSGASNQGDDFIITRFQVTQKGSAAAKLPDTLAPIKRFTEQGINNANNPIPIALSMNHMSPLLNGKSFAMDRVMPFEKVELGSHKKIRIFHQNNGRGMGMMMSMAHPIHLHGQQYQIISRNNAAMSDATYASVKDGFIDSGWKDTVLVMPGQEIEIIKPFEDYSGLFLYHCHNLEHEDMGMMRQFYIA